MDFFDPAPTGDMLSDARRLARLERPDAAALAGVKLVTLIRQETGQTRVHPAIYRLFLTRAGYLADPEWIGWRVTQGQLWTPENWGIRPGEARSLPLLHQLIAEYRRQLREHWRTREEPTPAATAGGRVIPFQRP